MKEIMKYKKIRTFLTMMFFAFLRENNLLTQWIVNVTLRGFYRDDKGNRLGIFKVLERLKPTEWIDVFTWAYCSRNFENTRPFKSYNTNAHDEWSNINELWQQTPFMLMFRDIIRAYEGNTRNIELPTVIPEEAILALISIFKNEELLERCSQDRSNLLMPNGITRTAIDCYIRWDRTPQGFNFWCAIHNAICDSRDMRSYLKATG